MDLKKILPIYKNCLSQPVINKANIHIHHSTFVSSEWSQLDIGSMEKIKYCLYTYFDHSPKFSMSPKEISKELLGKYSFSGLYKAVISKYDNGPKNGYFIISIWNELKQIISWNMKEMGSDELIHTKSLVGCLDWNYQENMVVYISEKCKKKNVPFHELQKLEEGYLLGEEYKYQENFGESLTDLEDPSLNILTMQFDGAHSVSGNVNCLSGSIIPEHLAPTLVTWSPTQNALVFVAYDKLPFRRGLTFITTRRNRLCYVLANDKIDGANNLGWEYGELAKGGSFHNPTFSLGGDKLAYLQNRSEGPHHAGSQVWVMGWDSKDRWLVCDWFDQIIGHPINFAGVYNAEDFDEPSKSAGLFWDPRGTSITLSTFCGFDKHIVRMSAEPRGPSTPISSSNLGGLNYLTLGQGKWTLMDYRGDLMIASYTDPATPPLLMYAFFVEKPTGESLKWKPLLDHIDSNLGSMSLTSLKSQIGWEVIELNRDESGILEHRENLSTAYQALFLHPTGGNSNQGPYPLVVCPHGGPHSEFSSAWSPQVACFVLLNYCVLLVNYRGSSGYGETFIDQIVGKIGDIDVKDVQHAADTVLSCSKYAQTLKSGHVYCYGGSHGGFLAAHLASRYPDFYTAISCRNPVIDLTSMATISDIPEWAYVESGLAYDLEDRSVAPISGLARRDALDRMFDKSPISLVENVKCPILFLLGDKDLRVPCSQGLEMYKVLKARGIKTKVYVYPDGHKLDVPKVDFNGFIQTLLWFGGSQPTIANDLVDERTTILFLR